MQGDLVNLNINVFNKHRSGLLTLLHEAPFGRLIVKCLETLHCAYFQCYAQAGQQLSNRQFCLCND